MKKILTFLTGIVFVITILVAGSCSQKPGVSPGEDKGKVEIHCKAVEINGEMQFEMWDSNDNTKVVAKLCTDDNTKLVADDSTDVEPGTKVVWMWVQESEIQKFEKIGPQAPGQIITGNAKKILFTQRFSLKIPKKAPKPSEKEAYDIKFVDKDGKTWTIDPYLKIPH